VTVEGDCAMNNSHVTPTPVYGPGAILDSNGMPLDAEPTLRVLIEELDKRICQRFTQLEERLAAQLLGSNELRKLADVNMDRRLDHLNHLYQQAMEDRAHAATVLAEERSRFFTIQEHNYFRDMVEQRLKATEVHAVEDNATYFPTAEHKSFAEQMDARLRFIERWQYGIAGGIALLVFLVGVLAALGKLWHSS
jgi:hypothetical protein